MTHYIWLLGNLNGLLTEQNPWLSAVPKKPHCPLHSCVIFSCDVGIFGSPLFVFESISDIRVGSETSIRVLSPAENFKGSSDPSQFIFEINVGKSRIRHWTTLNLNHAIFNRFWVDLKFNFGVVLCRIRLFPTLISKIKWLCYELPLISSSKMDIFWQKSFKLSILSLYFLWW